MKTSDWKTKTLRELATINYGKSPAGILSDDGEYPVVGTGGTERRGNDFLYDGESIVLGRKGTIDRIHFASGRFWTIDTAYYLSHFQDTLPRWLYYYLETIDLRQMNEATGVPSLSRDLLYKIDVQTPSLPEQTKIAEILSTVDRAIEQTEALIAKHQRLKTGLMQDLLTRGIDEHGNLRSEKTHTFKDSPLGRIPKEWEVRRLGEFASLQRGHDITESQLIEGPYPVISSSGVVGYHSHFTSDGPNVVVGRKGTIGNVQFVPTKFWAHDTSLFVTNFFNNIPIFAFFLFSHLDLARYGTKSGSPSLNRNDIHPLTIGCPHPSEQKVISERLLLASEAINRNLDNLAKLRSTKTALMQDLLSGRKRVEQLLSKTEASV